MTKVRVSEETPNLSHSSNLISTVRLENPSPSLMRSIRARGHTHSWVVESILREQKREHFQAAREQPFLRARARIPRQQTSTEIKAARTALKAGRIVQIEQVVQQKEQAQKSRQSRVQQKRSYCTDFRILYSKKKRARKSRQKVQSVLYGFCMVRTTVLLAQISSRKICVVLGSFGTFPKAVIQHLLLCFGLRQLARISRWPYSSLEAQKSRSKPVIYYKNFGKNFEEFGSFSRVKIWHDCRDKFVI
jgi:hypothetical protein